MQGEMGNVVFEGFPQGHSPCVVSETLSGTHVVFSLCFGFVTNIAKCFILDVFPLNSDTAWRRMWEFLFCGGKVQEGLCI